MHRRTFSQLLLASIAPAAALCEQACTPVVVKANAAPEPSGNAPSTPLGNQPYGPGDVRGFGADPSGTNDSTSAFQKAANSVGRVEVPEGTYSIQAGKITLPPGVEVILSTAASVRIVAGGSPTGAGDGYAFNCLGRNRIQGGQFTSSSDDTVVANVLGNVSDVTVTGVSCQGCRILWATTTADNYAAADDGNSPSHIRVHDCTATAAVVHTNRAGIVFAYCRDSAAWGNRLESYTSGIQWWGGDAAVDGISIDQVRKARNLQIFGNCVKNVSAGGIWGSMGSRVVVSGNTVDTCNDVGIDFEGCVNCTAQGNTVTDGRNGCLATFFSNSGIVFSGNTCAVTSQDFALLRFYNSSLSVQNNLDLSVSGNSFSGPSNGVAAISQAGPYRHVQFTGNTLRNVRLVWSGTNNLHAIHIRNNVFAFDGSHPAFNAIECCGGFSFQGAAGQVTISGNQIHALAMQSGAGISIVTSDYNGSSMVDITDNSISGCATDIATQESGGNGSVAGTYLLSRNRLGAGRYLRTESGARRSTVRLSENVARSGSPYPAGVPVSGFWDLGQLVWFDPSTQGGVPGAVCVRAGEPGVWMEMASLRAM